MCFHSRQSKEAELLEQRFNAKVEEGCNVMSNHYTGAEHPYTPIITDVAKNKIQVFTWGLIPEWARDKSIQTYTLNAKIESLSEKPAFQSSISKRCLVLADGFMEWQSLDAKGKKKRQHLITLPNDELFAFAGLWSEWTHKITGEITQSYTVVTTEANPLMAEINNSKKRMPVILTPENESDWLAGKDVAEFTTCDVELKSTMILRKQ